MDTQDPVTLKHKETTVYCYYIYAIYMLQTYIYIHEYIRLYVYLLSAAMSKLCVLYLCYFFVIILNLIPLCLKMTVEACVILFV